MDKMSYLIVSPVRSGSSWLNTVLETHYKLYNVGESLCKFTAEFDNQHKKDLFFDIHTKKRKYGRYSYHKASNQYVQNMIKMVDSDIRKLSRDEQINYIKNKTPIVAKFTSWDLYEDDKGEFGSSGWGFNLERLQKEWAPLTTIFLYRKNIVEHFLSFLAYHRTGIGNATGQFMQYQRPKDIWDEEWERYYATHFEIMKRCYKDHKFDHTVAYEDLFKMDELCGVPLKQYHEEFTLKLNSYTEEELEECKQQTGLEDNYEIC